MRVVMVKDESVAFWPPAIRLCLRKRTLRSGPGAKLPRESFQGASSAPSKSCQFLVEFDQARRLARQPAAAELALGFTMLCMTQVAGTTRNRVLRCEAVRCRSRNRGRARRDGGEAGDSDEEA